MLGRPPTLPRFRHRRRLFPRSFMSGRVPKIYSLRSARRNSSPWCLYFSGLTDTIDQFIHRCCHELHQRILGVIVVFPIRHMCFLGFLSHTSRPNHIRGVRVLADLIQFTRLRFIPNAKHNNVPLGSISRAHLTQHVNAHRLAVPNHTNKLRS